MLTLWRCAAKVITFFIFSGVTKAVSLLQTVLNC